MRNSRLLLALPISNSVTASETNLNSVAHAVHYNNALDRTTSLYLVTAPCRHLTLLLPCLMAVLVRPPTDNSPAMAIGQLRLACKEAACPRHQAQKDERNQ